jgi:hypothetical protein
VTTEPRLVAEQAGAIASAWSPPGAPASWRLTAAQFQALRDDPELQALAATIAPDRLPPLLFQAAVTSLVLSLEPDGLRDSFPRLGQPQPPLSPRFVAEYRAFCLEHSDRVLELCARHRYQMNEVGRCADFVPSLTPVANDQREVVVIDIGTGAGLALRFDHYRYAFRAPGGQAVAVGAEDSRVSIDVELRGELSPTLPRRLPPVVDRVGIDTEPVDLSDPPVRDWLAACVPQEIGAITRFHEAARVTLANPARTVRGDATELLLEILDKVPEGPLLYLVDTYVGVFFAPEKLERFRAMVEAVGRQRDLDWISTDPLIPLGPSATATVTGVPVPPALLERNRQGGVFGAVTELSYRGGQRTGALLGVAHPSAVWLEWLDPATATS